MNAKNISLALIVASLLYGIWHYHSDAGRLRVEMDQLKAAHSLALQAKDEEQKAELARLTQQNQKALLALEEEHDRKLGEIRTSQRQQMAKAFKEFESIFSGNQKTLETLDLLEGRVKSGQVLAKVELEKLSIIASGIGFLQKQYQKPLQEFSELHDYFEEVAKRPNDKPVSRFGFLKRIFSKNFREAEKEYLREEGAKRAFEEAQAKFDEVYASAQRSMRAVQVDSDSVLKKLDDLMRDKEDQSREDLTPFFREARQALQTHQKVLDFDPEVPNLPTNKVQP